jgi:hypothetical protein
VPGIRGGFSKEVVKKKSAKFKAATASVVLKGANCPGVERTRGQAKAGGLWDLSVTPLRT